MKISDYLKSQLCDIFGINIISTENLFRKNMIESQHAAPLKWRQVGIKHLLPVDSFKLQPFNHEVCYTPNVQPPLSSDGKCALFKLRFLYELVSVKMVNWSIYMWNLYVVDNLDRLGRRSHCQLSLIDECD